MVTPKQPSALTNCQGSGRGLNLQDEVPAACIYPFDGGLLSEQKPATQRGKTVAKGDT